MRSRSFPAGNGGKVISTPEADHSQSDGASLLVFAAALALSGCGPANVLDPPSFITGAHPAPGTATYEPVRGDTEAGEHAFPWHLYEVGSQCREPDSPASCPPVRTGVEGASVGCTNPAFHGRVVLDGAAFAYWRPLASQAARNAFAVCTEEEPCRVFHLDSDGDSAAREARARALLERMGLPDGNNRWFLYDRAQGDRGWYELPGVAEYGHGSLAALADLDRRLPGNNLVSTGEQSVLCVVRGVDTGSREDAEKAAAHRFPYLDGAGRTDGDAADPDESLDRAGAIVAVSAPQLSAKNGLEAPVASTGLEAPSTDGALGERLSDLTAVGFDSMTFPFRFPLSNFVHDTVELEPEVPEFLTDAVDDAACHPLLRLAPGLVCSPWDSDGSLYALASPGGTGAWWRFSEGVSLSAFTRHRGRLDGAASSAFSFEGGSSLAALRLDRKWLLDETGRWRMEGAFTLAADMPRVLSERRTSMLEAGPALLSDWVIGVTHSDSRDLHTRLSLSQPPRAETGRGLLTIPSGRLEDGTRTYETHRFSLVPSRRQLTLRLAHQRPLAGGDVVLSVHRTKNQGHSRGPSRVVAGVAWRRSF